MTNFPVISNILEMLRRFKGKKSWSNSDLATSLTTWGGWSITERHLDALFSGRTKMTSEDKEFFKLYLLNAYNEESLA